MKSSLVLALISLASLVGCTLPTTPSSTKPSLGNWTNWQVQAGTAITSPPTTYPNFVGALQVQGSLSSGLFTGATSGPLAPQVLSYTGSFDPATQMLSAVTTGWEIQFTEPSIPDSVTPVNVTGGCVAPPSAGPVCTAIMLVPSVGVEIASLTGTYTGTLTAAAMPSFSGLGMLTLTQTSTPNSNGQFPLTGSLTFPSASDLGTNSLTGTVSGEGITLSYCSTAVVGPCVSVAASSNPTATQIAISNLTWAQTGPSYTFTGTLTRQ